MSFKKIKHIVIGSLLSLIVGTVSATERPVQNSEESEKNHPGIINSRALILNDFSGIESKPIVGSFYTWMKETKGDILVLPPVSSDVTYFKKLFVDDKGEFIFVDNLQLDMSLIQNGMKPWGNECSHTFYVLRTTSESSIVKSIDKQKNGASTLAFTYPGCFYKFIFVVADRISTEEELKTVMIHELGHMWGLPDNKGGINSIMNGTYNDMSRCITKQDMSDLYALHESSIFLENDMGCEVKENEFSDEKLKSK